MRIKSFIALLMCLCLCAYMAYAEEGNSIDDNNELQDKRKQPYRRRMKRRHGREGGETVKSLLIKDTTKEERERIVHQALWGNCGIDCEFCSGCDNRGGGRIEGIYQGYIDGKKEIREINEEYRAPFVRG